MAKWAHADVLDNGPAYIKTNANRIYLISTYAASDTYATVNGNKLAEATISSADWGATTGGAGAARGFPFSGKSGATASASGGGATMHFAFIKYDSTTPANSVVLWVTEETSDQTITSGNTVNFPALTYTANQPT